MYIYFSSINRLAKPELVYVNVLELGLKSLSSFGHNSHSLLIIAVDNWGNASVEPELGEEVVPPDELWLRAYSSASVVDFVTDRCFVAFQSIGIPKSLNK